jgi:PelA/Pel-15E family pectate lyase
MFTRFAAVLLFVSTVSSLPRLAAAQTDAATTAAPQGDDLPDRVVDAMRRATRYFHGEVAVRGGYVYTYSLDLQRRRGEGDATPTEIWVQPPGTPTVGEAYLAAFEATGDAQFLTAAKDAATALIHGQLESGGWADRVDFDPRGERADRYRNGQGRAKGRNYSTLDDDKTQSALRFLMRLDRTLQFADPQLHPSVQVALDALLAAQFPNGGFPQGFKAPVTPQPVIRASYPDYEWRTENRIKEYWDLYTLNDGLAGTVAETLDVAHEVYGDAKYEAAIKRLGDFLLLAQMPPPQPGWAQQYDFQMRPAWARKFEPPAVTGGETRDAIETLMLVFQRTQDRKYLDAIPPALEWLKRSELPDGQVARFYELRTNRPLYLTKDDYRLTYDDDNLPTHYGFKLDSAVERLEKQYRELSETGRLKRSVSNLKTLTRDAEAIVSQLDDQGLPADQGRWLATSSRKPFPRNVDGGKTGDRDKAIVSSELFAKNMRRLSEYLIAAKGR